MSPTKSSTPRLSEQARHVVIPKGIVTTGWPAIKARGAELGFHYDPWQDGAGRITFGKRANGKYAATVGGIVWSIPRQIGKTFSVGSWLMVLSVLFPGLKVVWTAHRLRTSTMTFRSMQAMARRPKMAPHIKHIRTANGEQEIAFTNGSVILFGAREQGFGRGFEELDVEVFDEAQILTEKALDDMIPAANQSRHPHGALLFFIGTPPKPTDPGEAFTIRRAKALSGKSKDMAYVEFSADADADPDDRKQWSKANPSYPKRTPLESMLRMRENLLSDDAWMREALGVWDDPDKVGAINLTDWAACYDPSSAIEGRFVFGLEMPPDRVKVTIGVAGLNAAGRKHLEMVEQRRGTEWVAPWFLESEERRTTPVVIDALGPAASLIQPLTDAGVNVLKVNGSEVAQACGAVADDIAEHRAVHIGQPELDAAVAGVVKKDRSEAFIWGRKNSTAEISPLYAVTLAARGLTIDPGPLTDVGAWNF